MAHYLHLVMAVVPAARVTPLRPIQGVTVLEAKICRNKTSDAVRFEHTTLACPWQLKTWDAVWFVHATLTCPWPLVQPPFSSNELGNLLIAIAS